MILHILRSIIIIESVMGVALMGRLVYDHVQHQRWLYALRDFAATMAVSQAGIVQFIRWDNPTWHIYSSPVTAIWVGLLIIALYIRIHKDELPWKHPGPIK